MASNVISNFSQLGGKCKRNYNSIHFAGLVQRAIKTLHGKLKKSPHKSSAGVAEGGPLVRHLMEVVQVVEVEAQLSTY